MCGQIGLNHQPEEGWPPQVRVRFPVKGVWHLQRPAWQSVQLTGVPVREHTCGQRLSAGHASKVGVFF